MQERKDYLDGLRGIAALIVVISHSIIAFDFALHTGDPSNSHGSWDIRLSGLPFLLPMAGNYAVCVFFLLSGFVLAGSFATTRLGMIPLVLKRYLRLTLPILAVILFSWALLTCGLMANAAASVETRSAWLAWQMTQAPDVAVALRDGLYGSLIGLPASPAYDSSLWTMGIEFIGSLLLILIFGVTRPLRRSGSISDGALAILLLVLGVAGHSFYLGLFAIGAAVSLADLPARSASLRRPGLIMGLLLVLGVFFGTVPYSAARGPWFDALVASSPVAPPAPWQGASLAWLGTQGEPFWHGVGAILTLIPVLCWPMLRAALSRPLPRFLGRISFPLYLFHIPLLMSAGAGLFTVLRHIGLALAPAAILTVAAFYTLALSVAWALVPLLEETAVRWSGRLAVRLQDGLDRLVLGGKRRPANQAP
ncbi:acyltransferase [Nitrospirillum sp. BR 11164]|uniref:acyltransferase family protein n=1 Tax=Nitrospirillum sp. BR 11164 TaxID=3104324 RepID=UPI002AFFA6F4|nr:acyltransferase [Nitrospirillum sp. BR 11164]MEA1647719.1 acyltransferase [Nitrospirillum sp. BR 11164]